MAKHERTQQDEREVSVSEVDLGGGAVLVTYNDGVPTQLANPGRATRRTVAAVLTGLLVGLPIINSALAIVQDELAKQTALEIPAWLWLAINGALAVVAIVSGIVTRFMALPGVNEWIKANVPGLAAIPLRQVEPLPEAVAYSEPGN